MAMRGSLAARLEADDAARTITAFPDGSVDHVYHVIDGDRRIERRDTFIEAITGSRSPAVSLQQTTVAPGGHTVNMGQQATRLGDRVTVVGHLDHPVLADLPVETISMGAPSRVNVHRFADGDVLTVEPSADILGWSYEDLAAVTADAFDELFGVDLVFCTNWRSFDAMPAALGTIAERRVSGGYCLVDPGRIKHRRPAEVRRFIAALEALGRSFDVVLTANGDEIRHLARWTGDLDGDGLRACLEQLRTEAALHAAVVHEAEQALAVTASDRIREQNFDIEAVRHTGGGDRFDAGLAHALVRDWSWRDALRLGNACAAYYISTGDTATREALGDFLRSRTT